MRLVFRIVLVSVFMLVSGSEAEGECPSVQPCLQVGVVADKFLNEISGITISRKDRDVIWAHNDGGKAQIWAMNTQGAHLGIYKLLGTNNRDWEDIAIGPGPDPNINYLYVADVGNNDGSTDYTYSIHRFAEPNVSSTQSPVDINLTDIDTLLVEYPDSLRHGCETILIDPLNSDIYLCTRDRWGDDNGVMKVYRYPAPQTPDLVYTIQHVADVPLTNGEMAVGGDVSHMDNSIIIRTKGVAERVLLWERTYGTDFWDAFDNPVCEMPSISEPQGEAVCFDPNGCAYYTLSEGRYQPIYYFAYNCQCPPIIGDFDASCEVDLLDLSFLVEYWLNDCNNVNYWCEETDIDYSGFVDILDFTFLSKNWH
jgi:hypothetical protein